jgi:hypothetical protein
MKLVIGILSTILMVILLVSASQSETITTPNLLSGNFLDGSWSGDTTSNHGSNIIAGVDKQSVSSTISVIDDGQLYQFEMNEGFTSTQEAEVWFWNSQEQSMTMTQVIVGDSGSTISQSLQIEGTCVNYNGCDYQSTGTNTIVIGANNETDYDIISNFSFSVPGYSGHMAADLKNPSLTISFTLPEFIEDFEAVDEWEEIKFKEEDIWADEIFEQFYMEEEQFFFTSPSMNFETYTMEYEDEAIKEMDMEFEYEVFNYESEPPLEETPMMYQEMFTEDMFEDTPPPKEMEEEETIMPEEMLLEEPEEEQEIKEEEESEPENFLLEETPEESQPVLVTSNIKEKISIDHVVVKTKIDMLKFEDAIKSTLMLVDQPVLVDAVFYPPVNLYPNQLPIADTRVIYSNVQFAKDPLFLYENKLREVKERQYKNRIQLESMTWKN